MKYLQSIFFRILRLCELQLSLTQKELYIPIFKNVLTTTQSLEQWQGQCQKFKIIIDLYIT